MPHTSIAAVGRVDYSNPSGPLDITGGTFKIDFVNLQVNTNAWIEVQALDGSGRTLTVSAAALALGFTSGL